MYKIKKRSGDIVPFELGKIKGAITRTFESIDRPYQDSIVEKLAMTSVANAEKKISNNILSVEDIQDSVESILMSYGYEDVAKAYILYRKQHENARNVQTTLLDYKKTVEKYTENTDWRVKENSTVTYSLGGLILGNSGAIIANYWLSEIYDEEIANAHRNCDIHIHDLSMLSGYCFTGDTIVKTLDGKNRTFEQLVNENVKELWVYSYDIDENKVVIAKAENPRVTRYTDELVEITLASGKKIKCTPDHPIMLRDGTYIEAQKLKPNMSVMPLNISEKGKYITINKFWCGEQDKKRQYLHRWVAEQTIGRPIQDDEVVHHLNEDKHDNRPENLQVMLDKEHRAMEVKKTMETDLWKQNNNERLVNYNKSDVKRKSVSEFASSRKRDDLGRFVEFKYNANLDVEKKAYNHRVRSVKRVRLDTPIPVYDLTVPKYHNFAVGGNIFVHNCAGWSLKQLIKEGLGGVQGKITTRPAKHLSTLCNQMVNFLGCFTDDTRIVLSDGTTPTIREMLDSGKTEWKVKSYDPKTNSVIDSKMDNLHKTRTVDEYLELEFEDGDIVKCTPDHKFYTYNRGWVEAKDLTEDDDVANLDYNKYVVYKITNKQTGEFYIGSHITTNKNDGYMGSGVKITEQVEKFGKDAFIKQILDETTDETSLRELEATYINKYRNDPLLLNKVKYVNHGFDGINNYKRFPNKLRGILVQKDGEGIYVTKRSLQTFLNNGYKLSGFDEVCVKNTVTASPKMLGKKHTYKTRQLMKHRSQETSVIRGKHISEGIRKIGPDGMNSAKRNQNRVLENGMTHHQMIMKKQMENGTNNFIKKNPNYIWFNDNGNEKRVTVFSVGCSPKDIRTRIDQIFSFYNSSSVWDVSQSTFEKFINDYPDWTGKFNLIGFQHSCRSAIKRNKLNIEMIGSVLV